MRTNATRSTLRNARRPIAIALAIVAILALLALTLVACNDDEGGQDVTSSGKAIPVYTGMTISGVPGASDNVLVSDDVTTPTFADPGHDNGLHKGHYKGDCKDNEKEEPKEEPFDKPLSGALDVTGGTQDRFYAKANEDVLVTVHIDNPDRFEILSFTLNGEKYSSYMFEVGSDLENLILKVNVGAVEGLVEYTIDAIKYVDGESINDVKMDGDRTVTLAVHTEKQPTSTITGESIGFNTVSFHVAMADPMGLLVAEVSRLQAVVYDGTQIVATQDLPLTGESDVHFEGLKTNTLYQYAVLATYDALDGKGLSTYILSQKSFYTKAIVLFDSVELSTTGVSYTLDWDADAASKTVTSIEVLRGEERVATLDPAALAVNTLRPNTAYVLVLTYQNGTQSESIRLEFTTDPLIYTVNHLLENLAGNGYDIIATADTLVEQDALFAPAVNTYEGFTSPAAVQITANAANDSFVVDYKYTRNSYNLALHNSGTSSARVVKYGAELPAATKPDYDFLGWFKADGTQVNTMPAGDLAVYATWAGEATADDLRFTITETDQKITVTGLVNRDLTELSIPTYLNGMPVVAIDAMAFKGEFRLTKVAIPSTVTSIGAGAFNGCAALQEITIPFVGNCIKQETDRYQYPFGYIFGEDEYQGGIATTQSYYGSSVTATTSTTYYIPEGLTKVTVTGGNILRGAFYQCTKLTTVNLPEGLTAIGDRAFGICRSLPTIELPEGITTIGQHAFSECASLTAITLPSTLKKLSNRTFMGCPLTAIELPSGLEVIEQAAFFRCSELQSITVAQGNTKFRMESGCLIDIENKTVIRAISNATIPTGAGVKVIGDGAFSAANWLTAITIPANIEVLQRYAFYGCFNMQTLQFAENSTLKEIGMGAFERCAKISVVEIPTSVTKMGSSVFTNCKALTSLSLPFVGEKAVTESDTWQYPLGHIFGALASNAAAPTGFEKVLQSYYGSSLESITSTYYSIPAGLTNVTITGSTHLPAYAFQNCSMLESITLPTTLKTIGSYAFRHCRKLESLTIPSGVTSIGSFVLHGCTALESLTIPFVGDRVKTATDEKQYPLGYLFGGYNDEKNQQVRQYYVNSVSGTTINTANSYYYIPKSLTSVTVTGGNILYGAFYGCTMLTNVTLPQNITSIGQNAFYGCTGLSEISFPNGLTAIDNNAFYQCTSLEELTLPASLTSLSGTSFRGCAKLSTLYYNATQLTREPGNSPFRGCGTEGDGLTVFVGANVAAIPTYLFYNKDTANPVTLKSITFAAGSICASIGDNAFYGCSGLESIDLPTTLESIGTNAFSGCSKLQSIHLPQDLTTIMGNAFRGCTALSEVTIPSGLTSIGGGCFMGCTNLTTVYYNATAYPDLTSGSPFRGCGTAENGLTVHIGANVESIPKQMFAAFADAETDEYKMFLKAVVFAQNSVCTSIGISAFQYCSMLESINLPQGLTSIGSTAFYQCTALESIDLPTTLKTIGSSAFRNCTGLETLTIPAGVTSIGVSALSGCIALESLTIPFVGTSAKSATDTNQYPFGYIFGTNTVAEATAVKQPYISSGTTTVNSIYYIPSGLKSVTVTGGNILQGAFHGCTMLTNVTLPQGLTSIGASAFYNCTGLTSVSLPTTVQAVDHNAFNGCSKLQSIKLPQGLLSIGVSAFLNCISLQSVTLPATLTTIGTNAFSNCHKLAEVLNHTSLNIIAGSKDFGSVGLNAIEVHKDAASKIVKKDGCWFYTHDNVHYLLGCITQSASPTLPANYNGTGYKIYQYAFYNWTNLTSIEIPTSVTGIGTRAFFGCKKLSQITIPENVKTLGHQIFINCPSLTDIYFNATNASQGSSSLIPLASAGSASVGLTLHIGANVTQIPGYLFYNSAALQTVIFAENSVCNDMYTRAFYGCQNLETVQFNAKMPGTNGLGFGAYLFSGCSKLKNVTLPEALRYIGNNSFENCTSLTAINIPASVTTLRYLAFTGCTLLSRIDYNMAATPETYDSLEKSPFYNCGTKAESVTLNIGEDVTTLPAFLFYGITPLTVINHNAKNATTANSAFVSCGTASGITLNLGANVSSFDATAYKNLSQIKTLTVSASNAAYCVNNNILYNKDQTQLILIPKSLQGELILPDSLTSLDNECLKNQTGITSVTIGSGIKVIPQRAFANCRSLVSVTLSEGLIQIGNEAFLNCKALKSITLPDSLRVIDSSSFRECGALQSITIPAGLNAIGVKAFQNCSSLQSVALPSSITTLGTYAFQNCTKLTTVTIGDTLTVIPEYTFSGCTSLKNLTLPASLLDIGQYAFYQCASLTELRLPDSLETIQDCAFASCTSLFRIIATANSKLESVGGYTFQRCTSLSSVMMPASVRVHSMAFYQTGHVVEAYGVTAFQLEVNLLVHHTDFNEPSKISVTEDGYVFLVNGEECYLTGYIGTEKDLTLPSDYNGKAYHINQSAFSGRSDLSIATIPSTITSIGRYAFDQTKSLELENGVYYIGDWAVSTIDPYSVTFDYTKPLVIRDGTRGIADYLAANLMSRDTLVGAIIPDSVVYMGDYAFGLPNHYRTTIDNLYYYGTAEDWANITFGEHAVDYEYDNDQGYTEYLPLPVYFYSATEPTTEGNYWQEDTDYDGLPNIWGK